MLNTIGMPPSKCISRLCVGTQSQICVGMNCHVRCVCLGVVRSQRLAAGAPESRARFAGQILLGRVVMAIEPAPCKSIALAGSHLPIGTYYHHNSSPRPKVSAFGLAAVDLAGLYAVARNEFTIGRMVSSPPFFHWADVAPPTSITTSLPFFVAETTQRRGIWSIECGWEYGGVYMHARVFRCASRCREVGSPSACCEANLRRLLTRQGNDTHCTQVYMHGGGRVAARRVVVLDDL